MTSALNIRKNPILQ